MGGERAFCAPFKHAPAHKCFPVKLLSINYYVIPDLIDESRADKYTSIRHDVSTVRKITRKTELG